jgi:outer membrane receptor protein involved in Fe transport
MFRNFMKLACLTLFLLCLSFAFPATAQNKSKQFFQGKVVDISGLPIIGAEISVTGNGELTSCRSGNQGIFNCKHGTADRIEITIRANGFSILRQIVVIIQDAEGVPVFSLKPQSLKEEVIVDVLRTESSVVETPASVRSLNKNDISKSVSTSVDGVLRQTVGFSLFRRSDSTTANPTTQGASLRGVNSSGASRSKVLSDGVPVNDPFGGWIVWGRIPKASLERIEILRGGGSSIYGSGSIGGAIDLIPRTIKGEAFEISGDLAFGTSKTFDGSLFSGVKKHGWSADIVLASFQTRGYKTVEQAARGSVDDFANSRNTNGSLKITKRYGRFNRVFASSTFFGEARNNGTPIQKNRTHTRNFSAGAEFAFDSRSSIKHSQLSHLTAIRKGWCGFKESRLNESDFLPDFQLIFLAIISTPVSILLR